jgi:DNA-directed RNA polymerase subunit RPC12/RpoP
LIKIRISRVVLKYRFLPLLEFFTPIYTHSFCQNRFFTMASGSFFNLLILFFICVSAYAQHYDRFYGRALYPRTQEADNRNQRLQRNVSKPYYILIIKLMIPIALPRMLQPQSSGQIVRRNTYQCGHCWGTVDSDTEVGHIPGHDCARRQPPSRGPAPEICGKCGNQFASRGDLMTHISTKHEPPSLCPTCGFPCFGKSQLVIHQHQYHS